MTSLSKKLLISGIAAVVVIVVLIAGGLGYTYYRAVTGKGEITVPEFTITPSSDIKLGDLITVESVVKCPWGHYPDKAELVKIPEGIQVVTEPVIRKTDTQWGKSVWKITAGLQPFRNGEIKKSECSVEILSKKEGKTTSKTIKGEIPGFRVLAVDTGKDRSLAIAPEARDRSLVERSTWMLVLVILITFIALAGTVAFLIIWLVKRKKLLESIVLPPWALALSLLKELREEMKGHKIKGQICISRLTDIVRNYLEKRFNIHAPSQTTHEFLMDLDKGPSPLETEHKQFLREFLTAADMVKFAKLPADEGLLENAMDKAEKLVESTTPTEKKVK